MQIAKCDPEGNDTEIYGIWEESMIQFWQREEYEGKEMGERLRAKMDKLELYRNYVSNKEIKDHEVSSEFGKEVCLGWRRRRGMM